MKSSTSRFYDQIVLAYPLVDFFLKPQKKVLADIVNQYPSGKMLEIGVGTGSHLQFYNKHEIIGIDLSAQMLKMAEKRRKPNVVLLEMDGQQMAFEPNTFDYLVISHVIAVVESPEKLLDEAFRVLKPKGKMIVLNHFTPTNWLKYIDHAFQYVARFFHFKSEFYINDLKAIRKFNLLDEVGFGKFSYFKLLIYEKA